MKTSLADLLYPQRCVGCSILARGGFCLECMGAAARMGPALCRLCGYGRASEVPRCRECRGRGFVFDSARQAARFGGTVRDAIHAYKYQSVRSLAAPLAILAAEAAAAADPGRGAVVTWVPAAEARMAVRGFDHGAALATEVARILRLQAAALLRRARHTSAQMALEPHVRKTNVSGAFRAEDAAEQVLLVDDVFTTGATANEAARALKKAGAKRVCIACVARTPAATGSYNGSGFSSGSVVAGDGRHSS